MKVQKVELALRVKDLRTNKVGIFGYRNDGDKIPFYSVTPVHNELQDFYNYCKRQNIIVK